MATNSPRVSICIPAFRAEKFLSETLGSVASQRFADWEVIVTEDGSSDGTQSIVTSFGASVSQPVIYNRHERNRGLPATRNTGISTARGQWIAFLDADDLWDEDHLALLVETATAGDVDIAFAGTIPFDSDSRVSMAPCAPTADDLSELPLALYTGRLSILPSSVLVDRRVFERFGLISTDYPHVNDTEFWLRVLRGGGSIAYTGRNTCRYRKHPGAMSLRAGEILTDTAELCERYRAWNAIPPAVARRRVSNIYRYAARATVAADPRKALALTLRSLRVAPFDARSWFSFASLCARAARGAFFALRRTPMRAAGT